MHLIRRRDYLRGLGLGAGGFLLAPLCRGLLAEAAGAPVNRRRFVVFTAGNGWGHQGQPRDAFAMGGNLYTTVRSETDWDLPAALMPLAAYKSKLTVMGPLPHPYGNNQHGCNNSTLSCVPTIAPNNQHGGISLDRFIGQKIGAGDAFPSVIVATSEFGRIDGPAIHTSADGPMQPVAAPNTPVRAFAKYLGGASGSLPGVDPMVAFDQDRSVLDAMVADVKRVQSRFVGYEKRKFDQILDSCREFENQLVQRQAKTGAGAAGAPLPPTVDKSGLNPDTVKGHTDVLFQALAFGMTHVGHMSWMGRDAYNDSWSSIGVPGDMHLSIMHGQVKNPPPGFDLTKAVQTVLQFHASEVARLFDRLKQVPEDGGTMADNTLLMWINSGGAKHHDGSATMPLVFVGDLRGQWAGAGKWLKFPGRNVSDAFVTAARAVGVDTMTFGDPKVCKGPLF
jgi:hypothetical protein